MNALPTLPSYAEVLDELQQASSPFNPSELHGLLCGLICGARNTKVPNWNSIVDKNKTLKGLGNLEVLYEMSFNQISEFSFDFNLLLPEDTVDINQRAEALGFWCQGFLTALKQCKIPLESRSPSELSDTLKDLTEIAQVSYGDIAENEEDESAYYELIEYVRLAVLMIFHELRKGIENQADASKDSLH